MTRTILSGRLAFWVSVIAVTAAEVLVLWSHEDRLLVVLALLIVTALAGALSLATSELRRYAHELEEERLDRILTLDLADAPTGTDLLDMALRSVVDRTDWVLGGAVLPIENGLHTPSPLSLRGDRPSLWSAILSLAHQEPMVGPTVVDATSGTVAFPAGATCSLLFVVHDFDDARMLRLSAVATQVDLALRSLEGAMDRSVRRFAALVQHASDAVVVVDGETGVITYATPAAVRMFGDVAADGVTLAELVIDDDEDALGLLSPALLGGERGEPVSEDLRFIDATGRVFDAEVVGSDLTDDENIGGWVFTIRDVSHRRHLERELRDRAFNDSLTGLANRGLFAERIEHALSMPCATAGSIAVLFIDLDDFKAINDSRGHGAGDELLVNIGGRLQALVRSGDTVARLGGDEFGVLLTGMSDRGDAVRLADKILEALRFPVIVGADEVFVTASIGIAHPGDGDVDSAPSVRAEAIQRDADLAMYSAKGLGKNRRAVYKVELLDDALESLAIKSDLRHALDRGEFRVEYQPLIDMRSGAVRATEALVRWQHPQRGLVAPGEFIEMAEESGVIVTLGAWVLEHSCRDARPWLALDPALHLNVNVSPRQFQEVDFAANVVQILDRTEFPPTNLTLEITESLLLSVNDVTAGHVETLRQLGVGIAIDDFGTGYSSLQSLATIPATELKIDRSFVASLTGTGSGAADDRHGIVSTVIELARTFGLEVVAEGVEHDHQQVTLLDLGCTVAQGFLYARPMGADAMRAEIDARCVRI